MLNFWVKFISTYDITTEVVVILLSLILLLSIAISRPERNHMCNMIMVGTHCSLITMCLHIGMLAATLYLNLTKSMVVFNILYCLHSLVYVAVIDIIYLYISHLTLKRRLNLTISILNVVVLSIVSHIILAYPLVTGKLFVIEDCVYKLTSFFNINVLCSIICALMSFGTIFYNRNSVSKVVFLGCMIFIPIDALGAVLQYFIPTAYFLCATYVIPFIIFFLLFHMYRFDEVTGSQYYEAEPYMIRKMLSSRNDYLLLSVHYPRLEYLDYKEIKERFIFNSNEICKKIENVHRGTRIYRITNYRYHVICPVKSSEDFDRTKDALLKIFEEQSLVGGGRYKTTKHILIAHKFDQIKDGEVYNSFINHMQRKFVNPNQSQIIIAEETDCERYVKGAMIEAGLLDIRNSQNYDDDRVLLYIQPIYSINEQKFKTGEALMRLKMNGKMIFPDEFISVAESTECIHALTKIMLFKVAKKTIELSCNPDFEALTVNVSTFELDDPEAGEEFLEIIKMAGANPKNIRLEITESTTISDYTQIIANMEFLISHGIEFYLDDFGTGYSNLDRIVRFPFKTIKFDKSLLYRALEDSSSEELFVVLLKHFKSKGFYTVIEGVEDECQKEYVTKNGFDYIQGYYFSKPVPENEIDSFYA